MIGSLHNNICNGHKISRKVMKLMSSKQIQKIEEFAGQEELLLIINNKHIFK